MGGGMGEEDGRVGWEMTKKGQRGGRGEESGGLGEGERGRGR